MLPAETTVFCHLKSVGIILLVLHRVIISLLAFAAGKCDSDSHLLGTSDIKYLPHH